MITVKYFDHFDSFAFAFEELSHIEGNDFGLLNASGEKWRHLRTKFQPAFNLANMKNYAANINMVIIVYSFEFGKFKLLPKN